MGKIRRLTIYSDMINKPRRILTLSDLHMGFKRKSNVDILKRIPELSPDNFDYILMPGDIVHSGASLKDEKNFVEVAQTIAEITGNTKTYVSIGNHEQYERKGFEQWQEFDDTLAKECFNSLPNVRVIENNEVINDGDIEFSAFNQDPGFYLHHHEDYHNFLAEFFAKVDEGIFSSRSFSILLLHDPKSIYSVSNSIRTSVLPNTNLVVSGHMHNGLTPNHLQKLLGGRGLISPNFDLLPPNAYGVKQIGDTVFLVNGAVSSFIEMPLINKLYGVNCTIIELEPSKKHTLTYTYK